jgi:hypothetical protein
VTVSNQDTTISRGDSALLNISLTDANGAPFSLTPGGSIKYRMANNPHSGDDETHIRKDLTTGITLVGGVASVPILPEETNLPPNIYYHELKVFDVNGVDISTAMTGAFIIKQSLQLPSAKQAKASLDLGGSVKF